MSIHYAFESRESANRMLRNVAGRLCEGGVFVGTVPDAAQIVSEISNGGGLKCGNNLLHIEFEANEWARVLEAQTSWTTTGSISPPDPFGVRYKFSLHDAVEGCW